MDKSILEQISKNLIKIETLSFESLFEVINFHDDIGVCEIARKTLYQKLMVSFLENFLKDDHFDKDKNDSIIIYEFFKDFCTDESVSQTIFLEHLAFDYSEISLLKAWNHLDVYSLQFDELATIICDCKYASITEKAWDIFQEKIEYGLGIVEKEEQSEPFTSLCMICFKSKNEIFTSECWRLLKKYNFGDNEFLAIIIDNNNTAIIEYAWKHINVSFLKENDLIKIIKHTKNKNVAHEALDIFRKLKNSF